MTIIRLHAAHADRDSGIARGARKALAILGVAFGLTLAQPAEAQSEPPLDNAQIAEAMHTYFRGEKGVAPLLFGVGITGVGAGTVMVLQGSEATRGAGFPMIGIGLVQTLVGSGLLFGIDSRVAKLDAELAKDPAAWKRAESKRMSGVSAQLIALMVIESALIVGGTVTTVVASQKECCSTLKGVGVGLAAESAFTLLYDIFEYRRARDYADSLGRFEPSSGASSSKVGGGAAPMSFRPISFSGRF